MSPKPPFDRARILDAAHRVIAERGYTKATVRDIARAAGCSEGTIYNHFADKDDLLVVCAVERDPAAIALLATLPDRAGSGELRDHLVELLVTLGDLHREIVPVLASMWADPALMARHKATVHERLPAPLRDGPVPAVAAYLAAEQDHGRIAADADPTVLATLLLAVPFSYAIWEHSGFAAVLHPDRDAYFTAAVDALVAGIASPRRGRTRRAPEPRSRRS
jgi:AcrR family transcriptional regulator